ncbi:hypothetical protein H5411_27065 [Amycolatopsis echigonensis]|uniref:Uncharacterized protein n=1 Tax=Amycolatopsis echigonensis TaxID=2576905 RepID=A0A8E2B6V9_9PSEU|nr:hypothetical protein [Amycolatopsis echigonensis]MBB2502785.1 hypothetical protein [Amycolatopsis echigonensis]
MGAIPEPRSPDSAPTGDQTAIADVVVQRIAVLAARDVLGDGATQAFSALRRRRPGKRLGNWMSWSCPPRFVLLSD